VPTRNYRFVTLDVFTDVSFGGNPLAIFPEAEGIPETAMQTIAAELNLSETVFVTQANGPTPRLRIFTPRAELPFAGHPTVGTALFLAGMRPEAGEPGLQMETQSGPVRATIRMRDDGHKEALITVPRLPVAGVAPGLEAVAATLGLRPDELVAAPVAYEAGVPFTFVRVADRATLARVRLDSGRWAATFDGAWAPQLYVVSMEDWQRGREMHARMFAPALGIAEDPATGAAAAALAGMLYDLQRPDDGETAWVIHQGEDMGRPSRILLQASVAGGGLAEVRLGGTAVAMSEGVLRM
jgi:trans-2,3-dihydro-3-hydroxyanthranilate isomerase